MWNLRRATESFKKGKPWLLNFFDQLQFYPVSHEELMKMRADFPKGNFNVAIEETTFNLGEYKKFLDEISDSAKIFKAHQERAFEEKGSAGKSRGLMNLSPSTSRIHFPMTRAYRRDARPLCQICREAFGKLTFIEVIKSKKAINS